MDLGYHTSLVGWAKRHREKMDRPWGIAPLTADRCRASVRRLDASLAEFGLTVAPGSDIDHMRRETLWLGSFGRDPIHPRAAYGADSVRARRALVLYNQVERLGFTLQWARQVAGATAKAKWVRERIDRCQTLDSRAQDYLLELEMAAHIARRGNADISFEEPDIVLRYRNADVRLAFAGKPLVKAASRKRSAGAPKQWSASRKLWKALLVSPRVSASSSHHFDVRFQS